MSWSLPSGEWPAEPAPAPSPARRRRWSAGVVVLVVLMPVLAVLLMLGAVMGDDSGPSVDPQDVAACEAFRQAAADYRDGVLTLGELRGRFQDVDDEADGATGPVARAARRLLAAVTSDVALLPGAISEMDDACDEAVG